jgi:hypothetical protein
MSPSRPVTASPARRSGALGVPGRRAGLEIHEQIYIAVWLSLASSD